MWAMSSHWSVQQIEWHDVVGFFFLLSAAVCPGTQSGSTSNWYWNEGRWLHTGWYCGLSQGDLENVCKELIVVPLIYCSSLRLYATFCLLNAPLQISSDGACSILYPQIWRQHSDLSGAFFNLARHPRFLIGKRANPSLNGDIVDTVLDMEQDGLCVSFQIILCQQSPICPFEAMPELGEGCFWAHRLYSQVVFRWLLLIGETT